MQEKLRNKRVDAQRRTVFQFKVEEKKKNDLEELQVKQEAKHRKFAQAQLNFEKKLLKHEETAAEVLQRI